MRKNDGHNEKKSSNEKKAEEEKETEEMSEEKTVDCTIYRFVVSTHWSAMPGTQASSPSTLLSIAEGEGG